MIHLKRGGVAAVATVAALNVVAVVAVSAPADAAAACSVDYTVAGQWNSGFQGGITLRNTGDPWSSWTLTFTFGNGQQVTQGWGGVWTGGAAPSVRNETYNGTVPTGGTVSLGFLASWNGVNEAPTGFRVNGTSCGATGTTTTSTTSTTTTTRAGTTTTSTTTTPAGSTSTTQGTRPAQYPNPGRVTGDIGAHDPTVVKRPDGSYLVATTGRGIPLKTSGDRTNWRAAGAAFPGGTPWTSPYTTGDLWAPDLTYANGQYYLYYAASSFGTSNSGIYLATSPSGDAGSWTNRGLVISTDRGSTYNAIDPDLIIDGQGRWWLSLGSFWSGLKLVALNPSTGLRSGNDLISIASRNGGPIEAPDIFRHGDFYYLFVSFDFCCRGAASSYRVMVGRSTSITGPYVDRNGVPMTNGGGTEVLAGHGAIHGPGHQATLHDSDGDVLFYHYYADNGASFLGINRIGWDPAGWPFVF